MEYYDVDGTQLISQGIAIGLIGNYSLLDMPQKSMKLRAKSLLLAARRSPLALIP